MRLGDRGDDRESEARPGGARPVAPLERLGEARHHCGREVLSAVDRQHHRLPALDPHAQRPCSAPVADGVLHQVADEPLEQGGIPADDRRAQVGVEGREARTRRAAAARSTGSSRLAPRVDAASTSRPSSSTSARSAPSSAPRSASRRSSRAGGERVERDLRFRADDREGRAELVAGVRDEALLGLQGGGDAVEHRVEGGHELYEVVPGTGGVEPDAGVEPALGNPRRRAGDGPHGASAWRAAPQPTPRARSADPSTVTTYCSASCSRTASASAPAPAPARSRGPHCPCRPRRTRAPARRTAGTAPRGRTAARASAAPARRPRRTARAGTPSSRSPVEAAGVSRKARRPGSGRRAPAPGADGVVSRGGGARPRPRSRARPGSRPGL